MLGFPRCVYFWFQSSQLGYSNYNVSIQFKPAKGCYVFWNLFSSCFNIWLDCLFQPHHIGKDTRVLECHIAFHGHSIQTKIAFIFFYSTSMVYFFNLEMSFVYFLFIYPFSCPLTEQVLDKRWVFLLPEWKIISIQKWINYSILISFQIFFHFHIHWKIFMTLSYFQATVSKVN